jgi:hypothetical protein
VNDGAPIDDTGTVLRRWSAIRQVSEATTARQQAAASTSIHTVAASVPIPNEWAMATGQLP